MSETTPDADEPDAEQPTNDVDEEAVNELEDAVPDDADADGMDMMGFLNSGGIKNLLLRENYQDPETGHTYSQAALIADIINVMRMDTKQMAALHGIDVEVDKMQPERAAELIENIASDNGVDIVEVFQDIEDQRDLILKQKLSEDQHEQYMEFKRGMLFSVPDANNGDN